jgi:hypothetical protein
LQLLAAVSLYNSALDDSSFGSFLSGAAEQHAWANSYLDTLEEESEANKLLRKQAADNVTQFMSTDTRKFVTLTFNSCGGLANMVSAFCALKFAFFTFKIWRFASIYGIGRQTGRRPFIGTLLFFPEFN